MANSPKIEPGVSKELAEWRAGHYSDVRYKLDLKLEKLAPTLKGTIEVSVRVRAGERVSGSAGVPIVLDWRRIAGHENLSRISNVLLNGETVKPEELNEHLVFREGVNVGQNTIKIDFESPILKSGSAITRFIDSEDGAEYIYSLFVPSDASTAFPVFDQPDLKAKFKLNLTTPQEWKAVTNTPLYSQSNIEPTMSFGFEETKPISTYLFAFATGEFRWVQKTYPNEYHGFGAPISDDKDRILLSEHPKGLIYVRKSQFEKFRPHAKEVIRLNREAIRYFESYFDYKFPFPKYDIVLIPEFPFGGMEHAGATFLREQSIIFPTEPTANNYISRASLIFHEAAHQWFGDTVTMKWFDDLWLKEGFATFMAYKAMDEVLPEYDVWKVFYERVKTTAYLTDVTKGTTPIYQEIPNLNAAKSAYGNIVYQKAPSFLKQAEYYFGEDEFRTAVIKFLKKHEYANAEWSDLVKEFEAVDCPVGRSWEFRTDEKGRKQISQKCSGESTKKADLKDWADSWIRGAGVSVVRVKQQKRPDRGDLNFDFYVNQENAIGGKNLVPQRLALLKRFKATDSVEYLKLNLNQKTITYKSFPIAFVNVDSTKVGNDSPDFIFPNYDDFGYGIFLLDGKSRKYVLENIRNEKDAFLRSMMWGALWDSVRFRELDPSDYIELAIKNIDIETDETTISSILGRVRTAQTYYLSEKQKSAFGTRLEKLLLDGTHTAKSNGLILTYWRAYIEVVKSEHGREVLRSTFDWTDPAASDVSHDGPGLKILALLRPKDRFDIVTKLIELGDARAPEMLLKLEKTETDDASKRYAYAARAAFGSADNKKKYFEDFTANKEISESWIEAAFDVWNSPSQDEITLPYLERALAELPNLKRDRKIFFVNGWLGAFIRGQRSKKALDIVNKFLKDNPNLDADLKRKILENVDGLERAVRIRGNNN